MNKYYNKITMHGGYAYDSKREAEYAQELDLLIQGKQVLEYKRQVRLPLKVNNMLICNYVADFLVKPKTGKWEIHEVKGFETSVFKLKWKLAKVIYDKQYKFILIK